MGVFCYPKCAPLKHKEYNFASNIGLQPIGQMAMPLTLSCLLHHTESVNKMIHVHFDGGNVLLTAIINTQLQQHNETNTKYFHIHLYTWKYAFESSTAAMCTKFIIQLIINGIHLMNSVGQNENENSTRLDSLHVGNIFG